jgi:hypothetical protein
MERQYVSSSNIASIGYDASDMILEVEFLNGTIYQYYDVPQSVYDGLMSASSHGSYLDAYVKKGGYRYSKI